MVRGQWYLTKQQQALRHEVSVPTCPTQPGALPSLQIQHNQQEQHKVPMEDPALTQHQTNSDLFLQQHSTGDSLPLPKAWPLKYTVILLLQAPRRDWAVHSVHPLLPRDALQDSTPFLKRVDIRTMVGLFIAESSSSLPLFFPDFLKLCLVFYQWRKTCLHTTAVWIQPAHLCWFNFSKAGHFANTIMKGIWKQILVITPIFWHQIRLSI